MPWLTLFRLALVMLPTIAAAVYYGFIATPLYVSEARFVIRSGAKPPSIAGGIDALLQLAGVSHSQDDAYAVRDYLTSRDAMQALQKQVDLQAMYRRADVDPIVRFPTPWFDDTAEGFYEYFEQRLSVVVNDTSGLTTVKVEGFEPKDAHRVASAMLGLGEDLVNRLNARMQADAVRLAQSEVDRMEQRRIDSQIAMTAFRNRELILDPAKSSAMVLQLIGKLSTELADARTQIAETEGNSRNSPQLANLRQRAMAIEQQIAIERGRVANSSDGLADKIAQFERLTLDQEFATHGLTQAESALELARIDARRQQMFLERVVEPDMPDEAMEPRRLRIIFTVFGFNVIGAAILWLLVMGLTEHAGMAAKRG